jgi:citronellol/citronellal dehydrogenase
MSQLHTASSREAGPDTTGGTLAGRTILMSGGSRGIGLAIAIRAAREGANVALLAKTADPDPRLQGTIFTAARAITEAGGVALPIVGDVRSDDSIAKAVDRTVERFGGIDICINNASAINLAGVLDVSPKNYDLMQDINVRGTLMLTRAALPYLMQSQDPHVLSLSPPLNLAPKWLGAHVAYTMSKYGMTLATLGVAAEFARTGVAANCLWPRTLIATDAVGNLLGGEAALSRARTPQIMADAAAAILTRPSRECSGQCFIDDAVLAETGVDSFGQYRLVPSDDELQLDIFVDGWV